MAIANHTVSRDGTRHYSLFAASPPKYRKKHFAEPVNAGPFARD